MPRYPWNQIPYFVQDWRKFSWEVQERLIDDHAYRGEEIILVGLEKKDERLLKMMAKIRGDPEKRKERQAKMKQIGGAIWKKLKEKRADNHKRRAGSSKKGNWADQILKSLNSPKHNKPIISKRRTLSMSKKRNTSILTAKRKRSTSKKSTGLMSILFDAQPQTKKRKRKRSTSRSRGGKSRGSGVLSSKRDYSVLTSRSSRGGSGVLNSDRDYSVLSW